MAFRVYRTGTGEVNLCFAECGRWEGLMLRPTPPFTWKEFTEDLRINTSGQILTHSIYLFSPLHGVPQGIGPYTVEGQEKTRQEMKDAGWKELMIYNGNHITAIWGGAPHPYWMCLMGLELKPKVYEGDPRNA